MIDGFQVSRRKPKIGREIVDASQCSGLVKLITLESLVFNAMLVVELESS